MLGIRLVLQALHRSLVGRAGAPQSMRADNPHLSVLILIMVIVEDLLTILEVEQ